MCEGKRKGAGNDVGKACTWIGPCSTGGKMQKKNVYIYEIKEAFFLFFVCN